MTSRPWLSASGQSKKVSDVCVRGHTKAFTHNLQPTPCCCRVTSFDAENLVQPTRSVKWLADERCYEAALERFMHDSIHTLGTSRFNASSGFPATSRQYSVRAGNGQPSQLQLSDTIHSCG